MRRRGFFSFLMGGALLLYDRIARAICNPHLVKLLGDGPTLANTGCGGLGIPASPSARVRVRASWPTPTSM